MTRTLDQSREAFLAELCHRLHAVDESLQSEISRLFAQVKPDAQAIRVLQALDAQSQVHAEMSRLFGDDQDPGRDSVELLRALSESLNRCLAQAEIKR